MSMRPKALVVLSLVIAAGGCAVVEDHNENFKPTKQAMLEGRFKDALEAEDMKEKKGNKLDGLCFQLDAGILAHLGGDYKRSIQEFDRANNTMGFHEDRGVTVGTVTEAAGSMLLNEKTIPYKGEGFEKILVSAYQAKNYLLQGDLNEAMVEVRACYEKQKFVKEEYEKELDAAEDKKKDKDVSSNVNFGDAYKKAEASVKYPTLADEQSIYQLAYVEYLCQLVAERKNDWQEAKISAQKCLEIRPDLKFLQQDLARIARAAGSMDTAKETEQKYGVKAPGPDTGSIAVLFEHGFAPHKEELGIVFPIRTGVGKFALPIYHTSENCKCGQEERRHGGENAGAAVQLVIGKEKFKSAVLTDLTAVAFRYHKDRMPLLITKAIIRTVIKVAAAEATNEGVKAAVGGGKKGKNDGVAALAGFGAGLAVSIAGAALEQADLRAWLSLPASFQIARGYVPAGEHPVRLELIDAGGGVIASEDLGNIKVKAGKVRFIDCRSLGRKLVVRNRAEDWDKGGAEGPSKGPPPPAPKHENLLKPDAPKDTGKTPPTPPTKTEKPLKPDAPKEPMEEPAPPPAKKEPPKEPTPPPTPPAEPKEDPKPDAPAPETPKPDTPPAPETPKPDTPPAPETPKPEEGPMDPEPKKDEGGN